MENNSPKRSVHAGQNIQRFRLMRGLSQAGLAHQLEKKKNKPVNQQIISDIEDRGTIADEELLKQIAEVLDVSPEALKTFDLDAAINIFGGSSKDTYKENSGPVVQHQPVYPIINQSIFPLDRLIDFFEKREAELKAEIQNLKNEIESLKEKRKN